MPGSLITADREYQLGSLLMGKGTPYIVQTVSGLGLPGVRDHDMTNYADDGESVGEDFAEGRVIEVTLGIHDDLGLPSIASSVDALFAELSPMRSGFREFAFKYADLPILYCNVRPRRAPREINPLYHRGMVKGFAFQLKAPLPHLLDATEDNDSLQIATSATSASKTVSVDGTYRTKPVVSIAGPARNPRLTHNDQSRAIRIDIDVQVGETLVIDFWKRTVRLDGVDVYDSVRSDNQWWDLLPGSNSLTYSRSGTGLTGSASTASLAWNAARLGV